MASCHLPGQGQLLLNESNSSDRFSCGMFGLDSRVHLQEVKRYGLIRVPALSQFMQRAPPFPYRSPSTCTSMCRALPIKHGRHCQHGEHGATPRLPGLVYH